MREDVTGAHTIGVPISVAVVSKKGGVGKTSNATTIASILAQAGYSVLLVDLDPQSLAALAMGVDPLVGGAGQWLASGELPVDRVQEPQPGVRLLAGGPDLEQLQSVDEHVFRRALARVQSDVVIFDSAAGSSALSRAVVAAVDVVLVVTEPHPLGLAGAATILQSLQAVKRRALVVSRVDPRRALHRDVAAGIANAFPGEQVFAVHQDARLERALAEGTPTATLQHSKALEDIEDIASWIVEQREVQ